MLRARVDPRTDGSQHQAAAIPTWRIWVFRVIAGLAGCVFLFTLPQALSPWRAVTLSNTSGVHDLNLHRWSAALAGGPDLGMAAVLLYLAWRPMRAPLLLQWLALAVLIFLAANVPFVGLYAAVIALPVVLVLVAYPDPRALLRTPWTDGVRLPVLALGVLVAAFLLPDSARALAAQLGGTDELARNYDAASNAEHLINISVAALLSGMRRPGAQVLTLMTAAVLTFMGAAAISVPANPGSWGVVGGVAAIAGGLALAAAAAYEWRRGQGNLAGKGE